jgi:uncharacterized protein YdeI (YjbR/CyaY-like superfamily)
VLTPAVFLCANASRGAIRLSSSETVGIRYFKSQADFRKWLSRNHDKVSELWLGLRKKASGLPSVTYKEAVDEALCFGWIDGVRKSVDESSYKIRLTPRRPKSIWSRINIKRADELKRLGLMQPPGLKAFEARDPAKADLYSFENAPRTLDASYERTFKKNKKAWEYFQTLPAYYKRISVFYITSAKKEETRERRLLALIDLCSKGERLSIVTGKSKRE